MLKKLGYGVLVIFSFVIIMVMIMYFAPTTWRIEFEKWRGGESEALNFQIPDKSMYLAEIPNTLPTDAEYELLGSILENADMIRKLDVNREKSCGTPYLIPEIAPKTATKEEIKASKEKYYSFYKEKVSIGGVEGEKRRLLEQGLIFGDTVDEVNFDTCEKALSTIIDAGEAQKLMEKILAKINSEKRRALGKEFIFSIENPLAPEGSYTVTPVTQFSRLANFFFRFKNDPKKWNTGEQAAEMVFDIARTLFSQKPTLGKAIAIKIVPETMRGIYVLTRISPESRLVFSKLLVKLQNPIFTKDSIRKEIIDNIHENITLARVAPWYLRWSLLIDEGIIETYNQMEGIQALSIYAGGEKPEWSEDSPNIYNTVSSHRSPLQRNMLGTELMSTYDSIFRKSYYLSFLEKDFVQSLSQTKRRKNIKRN